MHGADGVNQPGGAAFAGRVDDDHIRDNAFFPEGSRGFGRIGGGGFLAVLFAFTVTFFPPSQLPVGSPTLYTTLVATGTVIFLAIPIIISVVMGRRDRRQQQQNTPIQ